MREVFVTGTWRVEPATNRISRDDETVRLEPRVMELLCVLTKDPGCIVSRVDLIQNVWPDSHVTDDAVSVAVYQLRRAFKDSSRAPEYIETVPKRGYRWLKPVTPELPEEAESFESSEEVLVSAKLTQPSRRRAVWVAGGIMAVVVLSLLLFDRSPQAREEPTMRRLTFDDGFRSALLRGWHLLNQRRPKKLTLAQEHFRKAIEIEPQSADAHAGLAASYCMQVDLNIVDVEGAWPSAKRSLDRSIGFGPRRPAVYYARGLCKLVFEQDLMGSEKLLLSAVKGEPSNPMFLGTLAWVFAARGERHRAADIAHRALQIDPTSLMSHLDCANLLAFDRRFAEAERVIRQALELEPESGPALAELAWVLSHRRHDRLFYETFRRVLVLGQTPSTFLKAFERAWQTDGLSGVLAWRASLAKTRAEAKTGSWLASAKLHARLGEVETALSDLKKAHAANDRTLVFVLESPDFENLQDDPRFAAFVARVRPPH